MTMRTGLHRSWFVFFVALAFAPAALSQQDQNQQQSQQQDQQGQNQQQNGQNNQGDQPTQPIPAYHSPLALGGAQQNENQNSSGLQPDTRPLAGAQRVGLGTPAEQHSYWQPSFSVFSTFDSNALGSATGWVNYESFLGALTVHRASVRNDLLLEYSGGGVVSSNSRMGNEVLQQFELGDTISLRRTQITFFNTTSYIPEASFGFGGLGGLNVPGSGLLGLSYGFVPQESILAARDQRVANATAGQMNYALSRRSSVTLVGGYSLLHFVGGGYFDFRQPMVQAGYNYQLTRLDTIAVLDNFSDFQFSGLGESIRDNRTDFSYAHRVTGRIAFQVQAGPEEVFFTVPSSTMGPPGTVTSGSNTSEFVWNLNSSLSYAMERGSVSLNYTRGVNGGSGVLIGAISNIVDVTAWRTLGRQFTANARFGYSHSASLNGPVQLTGHPNYAFWYGGGDISRAFGRYLTLVASYQYQHETSTLPLCVGSSCGVFSRNMIAIGITWQDHPFAF